MNKIYKTVGINTKIYSKLSDYCESYNVSRITIVNITIKKFLIEESQKRKSFMIMCHGKNIRQSSKLFNAFNTTRWIIMKRSKDDNFDLMYDQFTEDMINRIDYDPRMILFLDWLKDLKPLVAGLVLKPLFRAYCSNRSEYELMLFEKLGKMFPSQVN